MTIEYVKENIKGKTVIMVTHNLEEVKAVNGILIQMGVNEE